MKLSRKVGATSEIWQVFVRDSSSTTGAGLTGLVFNTASLTAYYHRDTDTTATAITLVTMTVGTFTSSGFKEIDATNMPGHYQFCPPNAALASGAKSCMFHLKGATNMAPLPIEVDLDSQVDVTHWNGTAVSSPATAGIPDVNVKNINNVAAATPGAAGGLFIAGTNAATTVTTSFTTTFTGNLTGSVGSVTGLTASNLDTTISSRMATYTQPTGFLAATFPSGTVANTTNITAGTITTATNLTTNNDKTGYALTSGERTSIADALLNRDMSAVSDTTARSPLNALRFLRNKFSTSGGTLTVTKEDDTTSAWTSALSTDAAAIPIVGSDPA